MFAFRLRFLVVLGLISFGMAVLLGASLAEACIGGESPFAESDRQLEEHINSMPVAEIALLSVHQRPLLGRAAGQTFRFGSKSGVELSFTLNSDGQTGRLILTQAVTSEFDIAQRQVEPRRLYIQAVRITNYEILLYGQESSPDNPQGLGSPIRYRVALHLTPGFDDHKRFDRIDIAEKTGRLQLLWFTTTSLEGFAPISPHVSLEPVLGQDAMEVYRVLEQRGFANMDTESTSYRGLRVAPYWSTLSVDSYRVGFEEVGSQTELLHALNGLRTLGLRGDHPIFDRYHPLTER